MVQNGRRDSNSHRGSLDIIAAILTASHRGAKRTHLMNQCNLSFRQLTSYSHFLLRRGLLHMIREDGSKSSFLRITDKGKDFLRAYRGLMSLMQ